MIGLLNGGMSGFSIGHSDIGGYTSINDTTLGDAGHYRRDEELLQRWIEMSTFSDAVFRTHPSNLPAYNAQIWDNKDIAQFFAKFAKIFVSLGDYKMKLMEEAYETGIPMVRSMMLEFNDPLLDIDDQFMLGSDYMMAPVFERGTTSKILRLVYFPKGTKWRHYFTDKVYDATENALNMMVDCPIGQPCVFKRIETGVGACDSTKADSGCATGMQCATGPVASKNTCVEDAKCGSGDGDAKITCGTLGKTCDPDTADKGCGDDFRCAKTPDALKNRCITSEACDTKAGEVTPTCGANALAASLVAALALASTM